MEAVAGFPRYDQYKDSGVEWIGEVPAHWDIEPGFAVLTENKTKNIGLVEDTVLSLSYGKVIVKPPEKLTGLVPESFETYQIIQPNDIIIRPTDLQNDHTSLRTGLAKDHGIITSAYICLRPVSGQNPAYLHYLLHAFDLMKVFYGMGSGLRQNLDFRDFKRLKICVAPTEEQDRIANFLDQKTAEIDAAIAKKQRLIELLKEQKAILINQVVTQGLDPNVPMRDSGVEWIGQVPEHWEVLQNRRGLRKIEQGSSPSLNNDILDDTYSVLKLSAVKSGVYIDREYKPIPKKFFRQAYQVKKGDFLMTRGNTPELVADICYVKDDPVGQVMMPDLVYRLEYDESIFDKEFVAYFFQSKPAREQIKLSARGSSPTMVKVSQDHIKSWLVPVPPLVEQRRIRTYLDKAVAEIGAPIEQANQQIQMLGELKSVLISEAVTGKIKL